MHLTPEVTKRSARAERERGTHQSSSVKTSFGSFSLIDLKSSERVIEGQEGVGLE